MSTNRNHFRPLYSLCVCAQGFRIQGFRVLFSTARTLSRVVGRCEGLRGSLGLLGLKTLLGAL